MDASDSDSDKDDEKSCQTKKRRMFQASFRDDDASESNDYLVEVFNLIAPKRDSTLSRYEVDGGLLTILMVWESRGMKDSWVEHAQPCSYGRLAEPGVTWCDREVPRGGSRWDVTGIVMYITSEM